MPNAPTIVDFAGYLSQRTDQFNAELENWAQTTQSQLLTRLATLGLRERAKLSRAAKIARAVRHQKGEVKMLEPALQASLKLKYNNAPTGLVYAIRFRFPRHGIFLEHGVGRGVKVGAVASSGREAKHWFSVVMPPAVEHLSKIIGEQYADIMIDEIRFLAPGVLDVKASV